MNFFKARLVKDGEGAYHVQVGEISVALAESVQKALNTDSQEVILGIRPEHIRFTDASDAFTGTVEVSEMMGSEYHLHVACSGQDVIFRVPTVDLPEALRSGIAYGAQIRFDFRPDAIHLFDPQTEQNLR